MKISPITEYNDMNEDLWPTIYEENGCNLDLDFVIAQYLVSK
jgi:hypothetical protein